MSSVVYFVHNGSAIKIGHSASLSKRLQAISGTNPYPLKVLLTIPGGCRHERAIHRELAPYRMQGEWFQDCDPVRAALERYQRDGITPVDERKPRKYRMKDRLEGLGLDTVMLQIDLHRLPMLDARKVSLHHATAAMQIVLDEMRERRRAGLPVADLVAKAGQISSTIGL